MSVVLSFKDLNVSYGNQVVLNNVTFELRAGEILGIKGPSGCGKSTLLKSLIGVLPHVAYTQVKEMMYFSELYSEYRLKHIELYRGSRIAFITQNPFDAFNPVRSIGDHLKDVVKQHKSLSLSEAKSRFKAHLIDMNVSHDDGIFNKYAFELSGGMCQRVAIALALVLEPEILLADEPTSALDVSSQVKFVTLLQRIHELHNIAIVLVSHNENVLHTIANRVIDFSDLSKPSIERPLDIPTNIRMAPGRDKYA